MIKEFNTASRLMTPLGCRGTQERGRQGLWRMLAGTGIGSKIYKFIHQKAVFLCHRCLCECACVSVCRWQGVNVSEEGERKRERWEGKKDYLIVSASCERNKIKQPVTTANRLCRNVCYTPFVFPNCARDILTIFNKLYCTILDLNYQISFTAFIYFLHC